MKTIFQSLVFAFVFTYFTTSLHAETLTKKLPIIQDTYTESIFFDEPHGFKHSLLIGYGNTTREGITRSYIKYDIDSVEADIEDIKERLITAKLKLYQYKVNNSLPYTVKVGIVHHAWEEETLMWNSSNMGMIEEIKEVQFPNSVGWVEIDITEIFLKSLEDTNIRNGIVLYMQIEAMQGGAFWSKECLIRESNCNITQIPHIEVTYEKEEEAPQPTISELSTYVLEDSRVNVIWDGENLKDLSINITVTKDGVMIQETETTYQYFITAPLLPGDYEITVSVGSSILTKEVTISPPPDTAQEENNENSNLLNDLVIKFTEAIDSIKETALEDEEQVPNDEPKSEVLGVSRGELGARVSDGITCNFEIRGKDIKERCTIPKINGYSVDATYNNSTGTYIKGTFAVPESIGINIEWFGCRNMPKLFGCITKLERREKLEYDIKYPTVFIRIDNRWYQAFSKIKGGRITFDINLSFKPQESNYLLRYAINESYKSNNQWIDIYQLSPTTPPLPLQVKTVAKPPYRFPLNKPVNVTQWHGKTAYNPMHTGIDFEATRLPVVAVSEGIVDFMGWDSYGGKCHSGGYYIKLKHKDGRYSTYLHMESFAKELKKGGKVTKGQIMGTSGNSGSYNCEKLSHHLHFEIRKSSSQATHINPVPLIDVDWSKIKTARSNIYPGRLKGNNPHPSY